MTAKADTSKALEEIARIEIKRCRFLKIYAGRIMVPSFAAAKNDAKLVGKFLDEQATTIREILDELNKMDKTNDTEDTIPQPQKNGKSEHKKKNGTEKQIMPFKNTCTSGKSRNLGTNEKQQPIYIQMFVE